jgi:hypothetical protein
MTELTSTLQIILQEARYKVWLASVERLTAVCFEDEAIMGFACLFGDAKSLLDQWRTVEGALLNRYAPRLREAEDKAWNVYSIFLSAAAATQSQVREIRQIEEDLERTRKIAACGLTGRDEVVTAMLPVLPLQYRPRLDGEDLTERLRKRIATFAPMAADAALNEQVSPAEVVRLLGSPT